MPGGFLLILFRWLFLLRLFFLRLLLLGLFFFRLRFFGLLFLLGLFLLWLLFLLLLLACSREGQRRNARNLERDRPLHSFALGRARDRPVYDPAKIVEFEGGLEVVAV